jgi:hypothetical protein
MSGETVEVALLELNVWASRAMIAAGLPGGVVEGAARLVVTAQLCTDDALAHLVADLPLMARSAAVRPSARPDGIEAGGCHALIAGAAALDLVMARGGGTLIVRNCPGDWVLPALAATGAARGTATRVAGSAGGWFGAPDDVGVTDRAESPVATAPVGGLAITAGAEAVPAQADRIVDLADISCRRAEVAESGFILSRRAWDGLTSYAWAMLVPTSERSKQQAGGVEG